MGRRYAYDVRNCFFLSFFLSDILQVTWFWVERTKGQRSKLGLGLTTIRRGFETSNSMTVPSSYYYYYHYYYYVCVMKLRGQVEREGLQTPVERGRARLYLKPWYSPTGSYLQIHSPDGAVACRSTLEMSVSYTTQMLTPANHFTYGYQVCQSLSQYGTKVRGSMKNSMRSHSLYFVLPSSCTRF